MFLLSGIGSKLALYGGIVVSILGAVLYIFTAGKNAGKRKAALANAKEIIEKHKAVNQLRQDQLKAEQSKLKGNDLLDSMDNGDEF